MSDVSPLVFQSKPSDELHTVEPKDLKTSEVINSMTDAMRKKTQSIADSIKESLSKSPSLSDLADKAPPELPDAYNRMKGVLNDTAAAGAAAANGEISTVMGIIDATKSSIATFGGQFIGDTNLMHCPPSDLFAALGNFFGDSRSFSFIDLAAEVGMILNMIQCLIQGGINSVIDSIVGMIPNDLVKDVVAIETAVMAAKSGDIGTVLAMTDRVGIDPVLGRLPTLANDVIANIEAPVNLAHNKYTEWTEDLTDKLTILDSSWDTVKGKVNLGALSSLKDSTKNVLSQNPEYRDKLLIAEMPFETDISKLGSTAYPSAVYSKQEMVS